MKLLTSVLLLSVIFLSAAYADFVECEFKTSDQEVKTVIGEISMRGQGPILPYELENFAGMVSSSNGYVVVTRFHKESKRSSSFFGKVSDTNALGGNVSDGKDWIEVQCSKKQR